MRKRCFVQMTGYEPVGAEHQHRRFIREMARFHKAWNMRGRFRRQVVSADGAVASWTVDSLGTELAGGYGFSLVSLGRFRARRRRRSDWLRFSLGIAALMEFILSGTAMKYFIVAWRYGSFFLFPLIYLAGMAWLSIGLARFAVGHLGLPYPMLMAPLLWLAIFVALRFTFGRFVHIGYALDDWYFARDFIHRARPQVEARLDCLAARIGAPGAGDRRR